MSVGGLCGYCCGQVRIYLWNVPFAETVVCDVRHGIWSVTWADSRGTAASSWHWQWLRIAVLKYSPLCEANIFCIFPSTMLMRKYLRTDSISSHANLSCFGVDPLDMLWEQAVTSPDYFAEELYGVMVCFLLCAKLYVWIDRSLHCGASMVQCLCASFIYFFSFSFYVCFLIVFCAQSR